MQTATQADRTTRPTEATLHGKPVTAYYPVRPGGSPGGKNKRDLSLWARLLNFLDPGDMGEPYSVKHGS